MADNNFGFKKKSRGDLELVYATHMGNSTNPATGEVLRLQMGWNSMGEPYYIAWDGNEWIPTDEYAIGAKPTRISLGGTKLSLSGTTTGLDSIPMNAKLAQIQVLPSGEGVAWASNGLVDVDAKSFHATSKGGLISLNGAKELKDFAAVSLAANGYDIGTQSEIYIEFFNVDNHGNFVTYLDQAIEIVLMTQAEWAGRTQDYDLSTDGVVRKTAATGWAVTIYSSRQWHLGDAPREFRLSYTPTWNIFMGITADPGSQNNVDLGEAAYMSGTSLSTRPDGDNRVNGLPLLTGENTLIMRLSGNILTYIVNDAVIKEVSGFLAQGETYTAHITMLETGANVSNVSF